MFYDLTYQARENTAASEEQSASNDFSDSKGARL